MLIQSSKFTNDKVLGLQKSGTGYYWLANKFKLQKFTNKEVYKHPSLKQTFQSPFPCYLPWI